MTVLLLVVAAFPGTENKFLRSQEDPRIGGEKVVLERLGDGRNKMVSTRVENSQYDSYMHSVSNEDDYDFPYMYEDMNTYDIPQPLPHIAENLMNITPSVPPESSTPSVANSPRVRDAPQPTTESPPEGELLQPSNPGLDGSTDCICVDYYLCDANNTIITNGEGGLINVR
jgi:hypothetical protein